MKKLDLTPYKKQISQEIERRQQLEIQIEEAQAELDQRKDLLANAVKNGDVAGYQQLKTSVKEMESSVNDQKELLEVMKADRHVREEDVAGTWNDFAVSYNKELRKIREDFDKHYEGICQDFLTLAAMQNEALNGYQDARSMIEDNCIRTDKPVDLVSPEVKTVSPALAKAVISDVGSGQTYWLSIVMITASPVDPEDMSDAHLSMRGMSGMLIGAEQLRNRNNY